MYDKNIRRFISFRQPKVNDTCNNLFNREKYIETIDERENRDKVRLK